MPARAATLAAIAAVLLAACGTRVEPQVFERIVQGESAGTGSLSGGSGDTSLAPGPGSSPGEGGLDLSAGGEGSTSGGVSTGGGTTGTGPTSTTGGGGDSGGEGSGPDGSGDTPGTGGGGDGGGSQSNEASDTGVTADRILVGNITTKGGPLGPNAFTPMIEGAKAYFAWLNAQGGVHGRQVQILSCDDKADPDRNRQCARNLIEEQGVFALVANSTRAYSAADYVSNQGVPDIGGQPIGYAYFTYPNLFSIRGGEYARDGSVGAGGKLYNGTAIFRYFQQEFDVSKAAVFYYNIPQSKAYGLYHVDGLKAAGYETVAQYEVDPALPSFDSYVADMRSRGIEVIFDTMDLTGNQNLCRSMERNDFSVTAKISTVQNWSRRVEGQFPEICKKSMFSWGESIPYNAGTEEVQRFRQAMTSTYGEQIQSELHQWHLEGWLAAKTLTEGVRRMGAAPTREGVVKWLNSFSPDNGYGGGGLIVPQSWQPIAYEQVDRFTECIALARWDLGRSDFFSVGAFPYCDDQAQYVPWEPAS